MRFFISGVTAILVVIGVHAVSARTLDARSRIVAYCERSIAELAPRHLRQLVPDDALERCVRRETWWVLQIGEFPHDYEEGGR